MFSQNDASIPCFVNPELRLMIGSRGNRQIEAVVFSHLPCVGAGARSYNRGNLRNALIAIGVNLLIHKDIAFAAGYVDSLSISIK